jgi:glycosyltransferase involved in cell wall biosynthesis
MRILWITPGFAADEADVNCIPPLQLLARELTRQGVDLQILATTYPFRSAPYTWNGIPVASGHGPRWARWRNTVRYAIQYHKTRPFEAIHSFWLGPAWLIGRYLAHKWQIPHVTTLMGQDVRPENYYRYFLNARHAPNLIALSAYHQRVFMQTTGMQAGQIIPWGIDPAEIPKNLPDNRPLDVLGCGSLIPVKNWDLWLKIVAGIAPGKPDFQAALIGGGPERLRLEKIIAQMGLQERVRLPGDLPRAQVLSKMREAKVFLHTSGFESFGYVLAEAAMSGCRVVSTAVGIAQEAGVCGKEEDALRMLVEEAMGMAVLKKGKILGTMGDTARAYLGIYEGLIGVGATNRGATESQ